jgi:RND family efflux transporter MFP subunit
MADRITMKIINLALILVVAVIASACSSKTKIEAIKLGKGPVESTVTTTNSGTVEALQQAELAFGTAGRITKIYVSSGAKVSAGAIIAELENADLKAVFSEAQKDYIRSQALFDSGLVSIANLDSSRRQTEVSRINLDKTIMRAPFDGMITTLNLKIGEFYQSSTGVTTEKKVAAQIIDLKKRIIKGAIDEIDLQKISIGQLAKVKVPAMRNQIITAKLTKVVPFVSTVKDQDRTSEIELEILTDQFLVPVGASADVEIIIEKKENANILPTNVLTGVGSKKAVFVVVNNKLVRKSVKIGVGNYEKVEILEGLTDSDIIAKPQDGLELVEGMKVEAKEVKWP